MRLMWWPALITAVLAFSQQDEGSIIHLSEHQERLVNEALDTFIHSPGSAPGWSEVTFVGPKPLEAPGPSELGEEAYQRYCSACHGDTGRGDGPIAKYMVVKPRDFSRGVFKIKTSQGSSMASDADLFRSISVGFPRYGMPSFHHLDEALRWLLVYRVKGLVREGLTKELAGLGLTKEDLDEILEYRLEAEKPIVLEEPPEVTEGLLARGKTLFETAECAKCHGPRGFGDGPSAETLEDIWNHPIRPRDFGQGEAFFKAGTAPKDIVRTVMLGIPGTPMPSFELFLESPRDQGALAHYVRNLVDSAVEERKNQWATFFRSQIAAGNFSSITGPSAAELGRPADGIRSSPVSSATARELGCLSCHEGINDVREKERPSLLAMGGGTEGRSCAVCHEGNPEGTTKEHAHNRMLPNPAYSWVVALGKGCGQCHPGVQTGGLELGHALPSALGGKLMEVDIPASVPSHQAERSHSF